MRKIYNLLMLAIVFFASTAYASARYWEPGRSPLTAAEIIPGETVVLQAGNTTEPTYLKGFEFNYTLNEMSNTVQPTEENIYTFEETGDYTDDGYPILLLRRKSTMEYVQDPSYTGETQLAYTQQKARAFRMVAMDYVHYDYTDGDTQPVDADDLRCATWGQIENGLVFSGVTPKADGTYNYMVTIAGFTAWSDKLARIGTNYNLNVWQVYTATETTPQDNLTLFLSINYPDGLDASKYICGNDPGNYSQAALDAWVAAYAKAENLVATGGSDEELLAVVDELESTKTAFFDSAVPFEPGYYIFTSWRSTNSTGYDDGGLYDEGTGLTWSYKDGFKMDEIMTNPEITKFIWIVTKASDNGFYFQNYATSRYIGIATQGNQKIPTTEKAEYIYKIAPSPEYPGYFRFYNEEMWNNNGAWSYSGVHAAGDYNNVVPWNCEADASCWYINKLTEQDIVEIEEAIKQPRLNAELQTLLDQVETSYNKGFVYSSEGSKDGEFPLNGLVTTAEQLSCNAPDSEEGTDIGVLLDSDNTTYFHSTWHGGDEANEDEHYLQADLGRAIEMLQVKWGKRITGTSVNNNGSPLKVNVYATNDPEGEWTTVGSTTFDYPYSVFLPQEGGDPVEVASAAGFATVKFDTPYRYVRLGVVTRVNDSDKPNGNTYFHASEVRFYEAYYDAEASLIEVVDKAARAALEEQMAIAHEELIDELATRETIDNLQAAYDKFLESYPEPEVAKELLEEAQAQLEAAEEGDELGYFQAGAKAELEAALSTVVVKDVMSLDEVNAAKATINNAMAAFNAKLNQPEVGKYYFIQSMTEGEATESYLLAANTDSLTAVQWGGLDSDGATVIDGKLEYIWKVENAANGIGLRNMATGLFMATPDKTSASVTQVEEAASISFQSAKVPGIFNIVLGEKLYANAEPGTAKKVVAWNSANGYDNSAFIFEEVEDYDSRDVINNIASKEEWQILTLPYTVVGDGDLYYVVGKRVEGENYAIQIRPYENGEEIAAGTPFIYNYGSYDVAYIEPAAAELDDFEYTRTVKAANGLVGTFYNTTAEANFGIFIDDNGWSIYRTQDGDAISANTGYIQNAPLTEEAVENDDRVFIINGEGSLADGISNTVVAGKNVNMSVYTLSGVKVRANVNAANATQGLPAGLYIVGGKKVLVK